jgi:23S rRNA G2069 N7-methylase RlmK/C1962 C5-methylase RlmI
MTPFANRLAKNYRHLKSWASRFPCDAFRVYDRDIPEYAVSIDFYAGKVVVYRYRKGQFDVRDEANFPDVLTGIRDVFGVEDDAIFVKERSRQKGLTQYQKLGGESQLHTVNEGAHKFIVNLSDYLDTGLFLDHRLSRRWVFENAKGRRVLNLFCYTGSVSVHALGGGAREVVSIDLSSTYLKWARDNLQLNGFPPSTFSILRADICEWLESSSVGVPFDLIFLDPPSFSNSKKMKVEFDVQRDHVWLVEQCMRRLHHDGVLFFSNNLRSFSLADELRLRYSVEDISKKTIPQDFRNDLIHHAWLIRKS